MAVTVCWKYYRNDLPRKSSFAELLFFCVALGDSVLLFERFCNRELSGFLLFYAKIAPNLRRKPPVFARGHVWGGGLSIQNAGPWGLILAILGRAFSFGRAQSCYFVRRMVYILHQMWYNQGERFGMLSIGLHECGRSPHWPPMFFGAWYTF